MNKCLIVMANPSHSSFTNSLAESFKGGLELRGHLVKSISLFQDDYPNDVSLDEYYKKLIMECDSIVFAFPWWCEMAPYPLVAFLQRIFVQGFAFTYEDGVRKVLLNKNCFVMTSMGQTAPIDNTYLKRAMSYAGLNISGELVCTAMGPNANEDDVQQYLIMANKAALNFY